MFKNNPQKKLLEILQEKTADPFSVQEGRFRFGALKDSAYYSDWTEESFLSDNSHKEMVTRSFNFNKLRQFLIIALLALAALLLRSAWLQVVRSEYYYLLSENNRLRAEVIEPKRGIIYDRNFNPLVRNKANFLLYFRPIDLPRAELERDDLIREISAILDGQKKINNQATTLSTGSKELSLISDSPTFYEIKTALSEVKIGTLESFQPLFIKDNIDYETAMRINLELANWPGVFLSNKIRREYLVTGEGGVNIAENTSLSHVLGYTGKISEAELAILDNTYSLIDYVGKVGLEFSWEKELRGQAGKKNIEVDALGRQKKVINEVPAQDGSNLLLSLDLELQLKIEEILKTHLEKLKLEKASVVVMNPQNGEILSLVSFPFYDNNKFASGISQEEYDSLINNPSLPFLNRAISGEFPSGSTIKPIFSAAALQEGVINENTSLLSTGGVRIGRWFFPDWLAGGHGPTNVKRAIAFSVNTFFYYIGGGYGDFVGLGLNGLVKYSRLFGLGEETGIDLSGEADGFVPTRAWKEQVKKEPWYIGDTYHFAIGQGDLLATPLQVVNFTAALANGGTLYRPHLVTKILDSNNKVIKEIEPEIINENFIDQKNIDIVKEGMRQTVTIGSGRSLNALPISVAGKTGTAQWSTKSLPHAWFIGFAPYENPEIAFVVLVEESGEGSAVAAPIAREIVDWYFNRDN